MEDIQELQEETQQNIKEKQDCKEGAKNQENEGNDLDYIFEHLVGSFGRAQWSILIAQFIIRSSSSMALFMPLFTVFEQPHRCFVLNCDINF